MSNRRVVAITSLVLSAAILLTACTASRATPEAEKGTNVIELTPTEVQVAEQPTATPRPTATSRPTSTPQPTAVPPTATPTATPTVPPTATPMPTATPTVPSATEAPRPTKAPAVKPAPTNPPASPLVELERIPDTDPAPPFTILVDAIRIEADGYYKLTGLVRNDGTQAYEGVGVRASFLDDKGLGYGAVEVYCSCRVLEPGTTCPFGLEAFPHNYVAYRLHPFGYPVVYHQAAALTLKVLSVSNDGIGNVRITGTAINENPFTVNDAIVAGTLIDDAGRIVSVGSTWLLGDILPGESRSFDLRIEYEPYRHYQLYAEGVQK